MRSRAAILIVMTAVAVASCTSEGPRSTTRSRSVAHETLLLQTADGPLALDVPSGGVVAGGRGAISSADGARLYSATVSDGRTRIETVDAATGDLIAARTVRGAVDVRAVSASGERVALMQPLRPGYDAWTPVPRSTTTLLVADPSTSDRPVRYRLTGNFEPEAFSTDGTALFLVQYLPAETPTVYRVTELSLASGKVRPAIGPFKGPAEPMPGTRLEQVPAVDGSKLFTLYTSDRPGFAPHDAPVPANAIVSFVHVLSLESGWAHCVGLPKQLWHQPASAEAMAASPDGATLYVVDADKGLVVTIDTESLRTSGPYHVDLPAPGDRTTAAVGADGATLYIGTASGEGAITAIDTSSFAPTHTWSVGGPVSGLGLSRDGERLYVALAGGIEVLDPTNGTELRRVSVPSPSPIEAISAIVG